MNVSKNSWIIHGFALMHAAVSLACKALGIADDLMLTLLSMVLVVILCLRLKTSELFMYLSAVLVNIIGFVLGMGFAYLLSFLPIRPLAVHPLATFLCTEIIGWVTILATGFYNRRHPGPHTGSLSPKSLRWLLVAFVTIIICRLSIILLTSEGSVPRTFFVEIILDYLFSCLALVGIAEIAIKARIQSEKATQESNLAHYRYLMLKQQVNPHFLFNSLNVLDCLILDEATEQASEFTHRLAEIYRYMLRYDGETLVHLRDELSLVDDYVSLLKVRFTEGLEVNVDIPEDKQNCNIVPCALQLLIENATKHNMVSASSPLKVDIYVKDNNIIVTNNIQPRLSETGSTGLGLKYLRQQYADLGGCRIQAGSEDGCYTVFLPLL
ncbi:MAG: sensor histidine kinase [Candidatus Cryptobacteroides sp.]